MFLANNIEEAFKILEGSEEMLEKETMDVGPNKKPANIGS